MPDDQFQVSALVGAFRRRLADDTIDLDDLKGYADAALAAVLARTEIMTLTMEGGSGSAEITCPASVVLAACEQVIAEQAATNAGTGTTHLNMSGQRIES
jgi:hypothetical protein